MATLRRRGDMGGKYELDYTDVDGRRYRIDTGTKSKKIAEIWEGKADELLSLAKLGVIEKVGKLTKEIVSGKKSPEPNKRLRLDGYETEYVDRCQQDLELAERTIEVIQCAFGSFQKVIGNIYIDSLSSDDVRKWKRQLTKNNLSKNTISIYQRALKTAFKRAVKWKILEENPFEDVEMPSFKGHDRPDKSMSIEEVKALLEIINHRLFKHFIQFILYTGARRNEILYAQVEDIDLEERTIHVQATKTNKRLSLPINKALFRVIEEMKENNLFPESGYIFCTACNRMSKDRKRVPWHPSSVTHMFKEYLRLAGLPDHYSLHSCRHTYVTFLRSKGIPKDVVQRLVGHSSPSTTDIYDHSHALFYRQFADMVDYETEEE